MSHYKIVMENKIVVLSRGQVSSKLEMEQFDTKEEAQNKCKELRKNYIDSVWVDEKDLLALLLSAE
jgi:hypothetical protein